MRAARAERSLLVECLLAAAGPRPTLGALAAEVSPRRFVALARAFAVSETAAHALLGAGLLDLLGARAAAALRGDVENATAKNALLLAEAAALQRALAAAGVASVALKGAALVALHYPALGARHVGDLDLLVSPADTGRAEAVLRALGCTSFAEPRPDHDGRPVPVVRSDHHLPPLRTPGGLPCELHDGLPAAPERRGDVEGVLGRAREASGRGGSLRVPSLDDLLGVACAHALGNHRGDERFLPRHVADVAILLARGADPERAARLHPGPEVGESLALLAAAHAGNAAPIVVVVPAAPARRAGQVLAAAREAGRRGGLGRFLFPAPAFLSTRYRVAPSSPWLPLLWAWRPLRAALRVVTGR